MEIWSKSNNRIFYLIFGALLLIACLIGVMVGSLGTPLLDSLENSEPSEEMTELVDQGSTLIPTTVQPETTATVPPPTSTIIAPDPTSTPTKVVVCNRPERVLILALDGMRPDAIFDTESAPFIRNLAYTSGAYTRNGLTIVPSLTIPAFTSLLTGYDSSYHGITANNLHKNEGTYLEYKSIFQIAKEHAMFTALVSGKDRLLYFLQPGALDVSQVYHKQDNFTVADFVSDVISNNDFGMMMVNLGYTDVMGHEYGWMSDQYMGAVWQADQAVQHLFTVLESQDYLDTTLVIITADHGGLGDIHSNNRPEDETIPWIIVGPCVKKGFELPSEPRLRIFDNVPTILWALGWDIPEDLSGRTIREAFEDVGYTDVDSE